MYFNTPLYNISNIKGFIFFTTSLKYYFFILFLILFYPQSTSLPLSFSMCISLLPNKNNQPTTHNHCQPPLPSEITNKSLTQNQITNQKSNHNQIINSNPQLPNHQEQTNHKLRPTKNRKSKTKIQTSKPTKHHGERERERER